MLYSVFVSCCLLKSFKNREGDSKDILWMYNCYVFVIKILLWNFIYFLILEFTINVYKYQFFIF